MINIQVDDWMKNHVSDMHEITWKDHPHFWADCFMHNKGNNPARCWIHKAGSEFPNAWPTVHFDKCLESCTCYSDRGEDDDCTCDAPFVLYIQSPLPDNDDEPNFCYYEFDTLDPNKCQGCRQNIQCVCEASNDSIECTCTDEDIEEVGQCTCEASYDSIECVCGHLCKCEEPT